MSWHTAQDRAFYVYNAQDEFICNARNEKTARHIAALPDLLRFAQEFLDAWDTPALAPDLATMARKAIAKATGEES